MLTLSVSEVDLLEEVWVRFGHRSSVDLVRHLQDTGRFPEGAGSHRFLALGEVFAALGYDGIQAEALIGRVASFDAVAAALARVRAG